MERLLTSLANQVEPVGRIVIVASGSDIKNTIDKFLDRLPIDYYFTEQTGQIRQRNIGIGKLDGRTSLVACIDDDIELDQSAIKEMVQFWNEAPINTGGVGFNIINGSSSRPSTLQQILFLGHREPGRVLRSGISTSISHLKESIPSRWLTGGTTVWRQDVLINNPHKEINTKWAIGEDLIFSYPIGKIYPLFVCASATVSHNHYPYNSKDTQWHFLYGKTQTLWLYCFVSVNRELSKTLFFFTLSIRIMAKLAYGLLAQKSDLIYFSRGAIVGVGIIVKHALGLSSKDDIREN
jgi:glycosyltransferase involved in cell wall biosynthesis